MSDTLQPILTDSSDFPKMRRKGCVYVDKTAYYHKLITGSDDCFFLARPRRFGKSLMISTLKAVGYDGAISIEHEDGLMSPKEGLEKAISFLKEIIIYENAGKMWWA